MQATNEIRNILAKGQAKAGANPLAVLDGIMSGDPLEAVAGGIGMGDSSAAYAKMAKLRVETRVVELGRSGNEAYDRLRSAAAQIRKSLITLHEAPTGNPYVAYFNKGIVANPAVVVAELVSTGGGARIELTAFTAKVGLVQGYSCNAPSTSWPSCCSLVGARSPRCGRVLRSLRLVAVYNRMRTKAAGRPQPALERRQPMSFALNPYTAPDFHREPLAGAPDAVLLPAPKDGVAPEGYHAMSIYPEYFKIDGAWLLAEDSRMDCVPVCEDGRIFVREFRHIRAGDAIVCGRTESGEQGIYVHTTGFDPAPDGEGELADAGRHADNFAFRLGRSRETAFSREYDELYELLKHEREHGYVVWVMGPAFSFNGFSRTAFSKIIEAGYVDAVFAGNALATHDLEGSYFHTALGQDIETQENRPLGHYNHLDTINRVRLYGSIGRFIEEEQVSGGIMHALEKKGVPYVLAGSIRDDGPLPCVLGNAYDAQDAMRSHLRKATTVVCMATMLHTIATGNMTPSYRVLADGTVRQVYFYCVDIAEFAVNKLIDRGSLASRGIVTNVQDFIANVAKGLGL